MFDLLPTINTVYPPDNHIIFEQWFRVCYTGCKTDRELLPIDFTAYWVNNDYGNNAEAKRYAQEVIDGLDRSKKWFTIIQYDDGALVDFKDLDVLQFNMSKNIGMRLPLLCQPHPYKFDTPKKYFASFVGSRTHPIRNDLEKFKNEEGWYISFEPHSIEEYCRILHESVFTLCPRGYGFNSFRIAEALQYNSMPVYISENENFIIPYTTSYKNPEYFPGWWVLIGHNLVNHTIYEVNLWHEIALKKIESGELLKVHDEYYTYTSALNKIIKHLEAEYHSRKQG